MVNFPPPPPPPQGQRQNPPGFSYQPPPTPNGYGAPQHQRQPNQFTPPPPPPPPPPPASWSNPAATASASSHGFSRPPPPPHPSPASLGAFPPPPGPTGNVCGLRYPPPPVTAPPGSFPSRQTQPPPMPPTSVSHGSSAHPTNTAPLPPSLGRHYQQQQQQHTGDGQTHFPLQLHQNPFAGYAAPGASYGHAFPPQPLHQQQQPHHQHQAPPPPQPQTQQEIDPSQLPRVPVCTRPQDGPEPVYYPRANVGQVPPPADSRFFIQDDGNASPELMRASMYVLPNARNVWHNTGDLPMGVICSPLAVHSQDFVPMPVLTADGEENEDHELTGGIPLVVPPNQSPPRCSHCLAYVNPFFENGKCNICGTQNRKEIMDSVTGISMQCGTVEYQVSGPYVTRPKPIQPVYLYALDLTCPHAIAYLDILERVGQEMQNHLQRQSGSAYSPKLGLALFCSAGILIRHRAIASPDHPGRYACMSDVREQPFCPLSIDEWTCSITEWSDFLQEIRGDMGDLKKLARKKNAYGLDGLELSCGGTAAAFLADALKETGGRGTLMTWRRPNFGIGAIPFREQDVAGGGMIHGAYTTSTPLQFQKSRSSSNKKDEAANATAASFYSQLAADCCKYRVALDIVMHTSPAEEAFFLDLATLGELSRQTCGHLYWINSHDWLDNMFQELKRQLHSQSVTDAVFKLRCSTGLQVNTYFPGSGGTVLEGNLGLSPEVDLPWVTSSTHIAVELEHKVGGIHKDAKYAFLQSALLYTTLSGSRRVRVSTLCLRTAGTVSEVYSSVDFGVVSTFLLRDTVARLYQPHPNATDIENELIRSNAREGLFARAVFMLANYRQHTPAVNAPPTQLMLPETMQLFPLFIMSVLKSPMLRPGQAHRMSDSSQRLSPTGDERAFFMWHAMRGHPAMALSLVHPLVISVSDYDDGRVGEWQNEHRYGFVRMPSPILASMAIGIEDNGVYFIDSGLGVYFVVGKDAPDDYRQEWDQVVSRDPKIGRLLWQIRRGSGHRPTYAAVTTVFLREKHQGKREIEVLNQMLDDAVCGDRSLSDFLINIHQKIRQRLEGQKK